MRMTFLPKVLCTVAMISFALPIAAQAEGHSAEYAGSKGYVGEKGYVGDTAARPVQQQYAENKGTGSQPKRVFYGKRLSVPGCPVGFNGMFRGNLYCVNGVPIK